MNKNLIIISALIIIAVISLGGFIFLNNSNSSSKSESSMMTNTKEDAMEKDSMQKSDEKMMDKTDDSMMMGKSRYVEYSKSTFDSSAESKRVLFFYANWCPTCRPADANFKANEAKIPEDVTLIRVNYNDSDIDQEEKALAEKYGITYQHTFVQIDKTGKEITKWNGGQIDELLTNIK